MLLSKTFRAEGSFTLRPWPEGTLLIMAAGNPNDLNGLNPGDLLSLGTFDELFSLVSRVGGVALKVKRAVEDTVLRPLPIPGTLAGTLYNASLSSATCFEMVGSLGTIFKLF